MAGAGVRQTPASQAMGLVTMLGPLASAHLVNNLSAIWALGSICFPPINDHVGSVCSLLQFATCLFALSGWAHVQDVVCRILHSKLGNYRFRHGLASGVGCGGPVLRLLHVVAMLRFSDEAPTSATPLSLFYVLLRLWPHGSSWKVVKCMLGNAVSGF